MNGGSLLSVPEARDANVLSEQCKVASRASAVSACVVVELRTLPFAALVMRWCDAPARVTNTAIVLSG